MIPEKRDERGVSFDRPFPANMMAIDGTWPRPCLVHDVSESGAKLKVEAPVEGLPLKEFFLVLSSTGLAYRRCELVWGNGTELGVTFIKNSRKPGGVGRKGFRFE